MKMKEIHRSFTLSSQNGANFAGEKTKTRSLKEINSIYYITMSYLRFSKMLLTFLICVMVGVSNGANAQTELASFSGKITGSEWTTNAGTSGSGKKFYYKMVTGTSITSPNVDVMGLNKYTFTINSASFGSITKKQESDILVSFKSAKETVELGTLSDIKGSTLTDRKLEIKADLTGQGQFIFTCPNATTNACARIHGITITGESVSVTTLEAPKFDKEADATYYTPIDVEITTTETGATIKYTTDGKEPSATVGTEYTAPVSITKTTTLKAVVVKGDLISPVTSATYTITTIENDGSFEKPYTPAEFLIVNSTDKPVWVKGTILGNAKGDGEGFDANGTQNTNVCIGESGLDKNIPIKLADINALRNLNLHMLKGKDLMVYGTAQPYFKPRIGIENPQLFFIDGDDALAKMEVATKEGYSTFYNANSVQVPTGVECGIVTGVENGVMTIDYKYQAGDKLPANTPVIVKAEGIKTYPLAITTSTAKVPAGNLLKGAAENGVFTPETGNYYYYKLAYDNFTAKTGLGFYWGAAEGGAFTMKAGKAYLAVEKTVAQGAQKFSLEGNATGIEAVEQANEANRVVYTLDGRRVMNEKLAKGLYIINGKKVLVK